MVAGCRRPIELAIPIYTALGTTPKDVLLSRGTMKLYTLYVVEYTGQRIRKVVVTGGTGTVSTVAGTGGGQVSLQTLAALLGNGSGSSATSGLGTTSSLIASLSADSGSSTGGDL